MPKIRLLLGCLWLVVLGLDLVYGACQLNLPVNSINKPSYRWQFGRRLLKVPKTETVLKLSHGEHLIGQCITGFVPFTYENITNSYRSGYYRKESLTEKSNNQNIVSLYCYGNELRLNSTFGNRLMDAELSCNGLKWGLYETTPSKCESPNTGSYVMAIKNLETENVLAHACYDVDTMTLQRLDYMITSDANVERSSDIPVLPKHDITLSVLDVEVENFDTIFIRLNETFTTIDEDQLSQANWLKLANYQYHSIAQVGFQTSYFKSYGALTDIIWWPNLLYGNWQKFNEVLQKHLRLGQTGYRVYAGTAGTVKAPKQTNCSQVIEANLLLSSTKRSIPVYVWNYLKSTDTSEEIVVIGYNSPFFEFPSDRDDAIFCNDVCHSIEWLQNVTSTFRYSTMGVIFCCTPQAVRDSAKFKDFPKETATSTLPEVDIGENIIVDTFQTVLIDVTTTTTKEPTTKMTVDDDDDDVDDKDNYGNFNNWNGK